MSCYLSFCFVLCFSAFCVSVRCFAVAVRFGALPLPFSSFHFNAVAVRFLALPLLVCDTQCHSFAFQSCSLPLRFGGLPCLRRSFHFIAKPLRCCLVPHLAIALPSMRTYAAALLSDLCFALPLLGTSSPCHCSAVLHHALAVRSVTMPHLRHAPRSVSGLSNATALRGASLRSFAVAPLSNRVFAIAEHGRAMPCCCISHQSNAVTWQCFSSPCRRFLSFAFFLGKDNR